MKSLRRTAGRLGNVEIASRAKRISSRDPLNQVGSVRTEMTLAPESAYVSACWAAFADMAIGPFDGDARLISAINAGPLVDFRRETSGMAGGARCRERRVERSEGVVPGVAFAAVTSAKRCA